MPPPPESERLLERVDVAVVEDGTVRIAVQVWGEAVHTAERAQAAGQIPPDADPAGIGAAFFGLVQGYILQRILLGGTDRQTYMNGVRALMG